MFGLGYPIWHTLSFIWLSSINSIYKPVIEMPRVYDDFG